MERGGTTGRNGTETVRMRHDGVLQQEECVRARQKVLAGQQSVRDIGGRLVFSVEGGMLVEVKWKEEDRYDGKRGSEQWV